MNFDDTAYLAVGRALTSWEHIESSLGDLLPLLVGASGIIPVTSPAVRAIVVASAQGRYAVLQEPRLRQCRHANPFPSGDHREMQLVR